MPTSVFGSAAVDHQPSIIRSKVSLIIPPKTAMTSGNEYNMISFQRAPLNFQRKEKNSFDNNKKVTADWIRLAIIT